MNAFKTKLLFSGVTFVSPQKKKKKEINFCGRNAYKMQIFDEMKK